ncbi:MAG: CDP-alcohol phosphatidyltransferase family protein [Clostridiales bacterium]|nr:CDP-alcohol phosphatidyltransferase family protein [Clostridiales bacterium]
METENVNDAVSEESVQTEQESTPAEPKRRFKPTSKYIVGYWHYGVILTYLSLALSVCGICFAAASGGPRRSDIAAFFVLLAGLCDAFDGMVASTRKNRTADDKMFGMQIDSLCDIVSFGIAPIMVGVAMEMTRWYYCIVYVFFVLCGLVRLAYFNVDEINRTNVKDAGRRESYTGLPITNVSLALPVFYLFATMFDKHPEWIGLNKNTIIIYQSIIIMSCYIICGLLFVIKFKMFKAHARGLIITVITITTLVIGLALIRYYVCGVVLFEPLTKFS